MWHMSLKKRVRVMRGTTDSCKPLMLTVIQQHSPHDQVTTHGGAQSSQGAYADNASGARIGKLASRQCHACETAAPGEPRDGAHVPATLLVSHGIRPRQSCQHHASCGAIKRWQHSQITLKIRSPRHASGAASAAGGRSANPAVMSGAEALLRKSAASTLRQRRRPGKLPARRKQGSRPSGSRTLRREPPAPQAISNAP